MLKTFLTEEDFTEAAKRLRVAVNAIKAVASVECPRSPFYADGFPTILFERHKFYKNAPRSERAVWMENRPDICHPQPYPRGGYGSLADQRRKFNLAFALDPEAAMEACSWGMFQELGENYLDYGFENVGEFVDKMKSGADGQLEIFVLSIEHRGLADELRRQDWAGFAFGYNGKGYKKFSYDKKIAQAFANLEAGRSIKFPKKSAARVSPPVSNKPAVVATDDSSAIEPPTDSPPTAENVVAPDSAEAETAPQTENLESNPEQSNVQVADTITNKTESAPAAENKTGFAAFIPQMDTAKKWFGAIFGTSTLATVAAYLGGLPENIVLALIGLVAIVIIAITVLFALYHQKVFDFVTNMNTLRADPTKANPFLTTAKYYAESAPPNADNLRILK